MSDTQTVALIEQELGTGVTIEEVTSSAYRVTENDGKQWYAKRWKHEFDELEALVGMSDEIGMPKSRVLSGDIHVLMMKPAPGHQLSSYLLTHLLPILWCRSKGDLKKIFRQLGTFVGKLHAQTVVEGNNIEISTLDLDNYDAVVGDDLHPILRDKLAPDISSKFRILLHKHKNISRPCSLIHGDLMPFHVYTDLENIGIIDFDGVARVDPLEDVATFESGVELLVRRTPYARLTQYRELMSAFEDGYCQETPNINFDEDLLRTFRLIRHASLLMYYIDRVPTEIREKPEKYSQFNRVKLGTLSRVDSFLLKRSINSLLQ